MKILLNDQWIMRDGDREYPCRVPCSLYDTLISAGALDNPYWRENEWAATGASDRDVTFEKSFPVPAEIMREERVFLTFQGIDTLAELYLNDTLLGSADNMHRVWEYDVKPLLREGENTLRAELHSPVRYIREMQKKRPIYGQNCTMEGYPHLRKAHYMFGWDWGPMLPDLGIWRDVELSGFTGGRIRDVYYTQKHSADQVLLSCRANIEAWGEHLAAELTVTAPDGKTYTAPIRDGQAEIVIAHPELWWVRGLGGQPLYTCRVELTQNGAAVDSHERRIGLRTLTISQEADRWGKEFCFINNGVKVFAMGANYIPEDQIIPRCTPERSRGLLEACRAANYNLIRVWGGGYYPDASFYDWCDENGLIIWQDFMFACSAYLLTPEFAATVRQEIIDNVIRLRNHASLGLWCGNNEVESFWCEWRICDDPECQADYLRLFEGMIPEVLKDYDPQTFYWPSSPSSGGGFDHPSSNLAGDMHYWDVWHNFKPIEAFRQFWYRFCSEYGFESLPDIKTVLAFAEREDLDLCGNVIDAHQKCAQGNEKVMYYLAQMVNYPYDFERLIYCSQLVQADCIRSNVEHMRRARGRCMGSAYWQVNDSNPVISWSSIDYFGRWKGLHYAARRFYAPVLLSCDDSDPMHPILHVTNDTRQNVRARLICRLRDHGANILAEWTADVEAPALSAKPCLSLELAEYLAGREEKRTRYIEYALLQGEETISAGTTIFVRPKAFEFLPACVSCTVHDLKDRFALTLTADCFAKSVCLSLRDHDCVFSDNWFDVHGEAPVTVFLPKKGDLAALTAEEISGQLQITNY